MVLLSLSMRELLVEEEGKQFQADFGYLEDGEENFVSIDANYSFTPFLQRKLEICMKI